MAILRPFAAVRPTSELAGRVAALPYDVMNSDEAREMVIGNPYSFLHVDKAEIDLDPETGHVELVDYVGVVDCGTVVNPNLARVQTEGGIMQGIGMTLFENAAMDARGRTVSNSFMQYKIPSRLDARSVRVEFESSYEKTGPYGAKSIGECVINTPAPAIADAVYHASGVRVRSLPITAEKILMGEKETV